MDLTIALAQTSPIAGDVTANIAQHLLFGDLASESGASLIAFPELSITGYELALANDLAFTPGDPRLDPLKRQAQERSITIVAGAPIRIDERLHIGAFLLHPDGNESIYTKRYLHHTETPFFEEGTLDPKLTMGTDTISFAICADLTNLQHAKDAADAQSTIYLAMALISVQGYARDADFLQSYAEQYGMNVFLSNYCTPTGGYISAGRTATWSNNGDLAYELSTSTPGLLLASRRSEKWEYSTVALNAIV